MQDLKEVTQDVHYENYRAQKLTKPSHSAAVEKKRYDLRCITFVLFIVICKSLSVGKYTRYLINYSCTLFHM